MEKLVETANEVNALYQRILYRDADIHGLSHYTEQVVTQKRTLEDIERTISQSEEKRRISADDGSANDAGNRKSYISDRPSGAKPLSTFAHRALLLHLVQLLCLIDDPSLSVSAMNNRAEQVLSSMQHIALHRLVFTIFPSWEYFEKVDRSNPWNVRSVSHFRYLVLFRCIYSLWKLHYGLAVDTCGTREMVQLVLQVPLTSTLPDTTINLDHAIQAVYDKVCDPIIDTIHVAMTGFGLTLYPADEQQFLKGLFWINAADALNRITKSCAWSTVTQLPEIDKKKPRVLILIAYLETEAHHIIQRMLFNLERVKECNPALQIDTLLDNERIPKAQSDRTPWSRVAKIRNKMMDKVNWDNYDYFMWIDSDIVYYPADFPSTAIALNPDGITAPLVLIEQSTRFYDWCGFQRHNCTSLKHPSLGKRFRERYVSGRNIGLNPPYVEGAKRLVPMDCVGCMYLCPVRVIHPATATYGRHLEELLDRFHRANVANELASRVRYEDDVSHTDHFTICRAANAAECQIVVDRGSVAYHADLPRHGEKWH